MGWLMQLKLCTSRHDVSYFGGPNFSPTMQFSATVGRIVIRGSPLVPWLKQPCPRCVAKRINEICLLKLDLLVVISTKSFPICPCMQVHLARLCHSSADIIATDSQPAKPSLIPREEQNSPIRDILGTIDLGYRL